MLSAYKLIGMITCTLSLLSHFLLIAIYPVSSSVVEIYLSFTVMAIPFFAHHGFLTRIANDAGLLLLIVKLIVSELGKSDRCRIVTCFSFQCKMDGMNRLTNKLPSLPS